jgi:hypothetical protein
LDLSNRQTALRDNQRKVSDSSCRALRGEQHSYLVDDREGMATERGNPWCVETSSNPHFRAPAFVVVLERFFEQKALA